MTYLDDDLTDDDGIDGPVEQIDGADTVAFARADWHLRSIARYRQQLADVHDIYGTELGRISARYETECARIQRSIDWHTDPVIQLHARVLEAAPTRKTIVLPSGTLKARKQAARLSIIDTDALTAWAAVHAPEIVTLAPKVVMSALKRIATAFGAGVIVADTGERIPGVELVTEHVTYTLDVS